MTIKQAKVGVWVKSLAEFSCIPKGTKGIIDEDYNSGITVAWDFPIGIIKPDYRYDIKNYHTWSISTGITRDGFDKQTELQYLEVI